MAYLKPISSKNTVSNIKKYLEKNDRNVERTELNISDSDHWDVEMREVKALYEKEKGVQFFHLILSPDKEEGKNNYNVRTIHQMGVEVGQNFADLGYQVVIETHIDNGKIHDHIIINSVNMETGKKLRVSNAKGKDYVNNKDDVYMRDLYKITDALCLEKGLNTLSQSKKEKDQKSKEKGRQPETKKSDEIYIEQRGKSFKTKMRDKLQHIWMDENITSREDFTMALEEEGLQISRVTGTGHITYKDAEGHTSRASKLGAFDVPDLQQLIAKNKELEKQRLNEKKKQEEIRKLQKEPMHRNKSAGREMGYSR
mgnify:FL=1